MASDATSLSASATVPAAPGGLAALLRSRLANWRSLLAVAPPTTPAVSENRLAVTKAVVAEADKALRTTPDPIRGVFSPPPYYQAGHDGVPDPNRDTTQVQQLTAFSKNVNALCQAYALTGDRRYADKAIETVDAWARSTPAQFGTPQARYDAYFHLASVWSSMAALKGYPGWDAERRDRAMSWAHDFAEQAVRFKAANNIEDWRRLFVGAAAVLTDDRALFDQEAAGWETGVASQIDAQGTLPEEMKRTRSLWYHMYALRPIMAFAELARAQGQDLYATPAGQKLEHALEVVGPSALDPSRWPGQEIDAAKISPKNGYALYRVAAARYPANAALGAIAADFTSRVSSQAGWVAAQVKGGLDGGNNLALPLPAADVL